MATNGDTENEKDRPRRKRPFYLNWQLWTSLFAGLILITIGLVIVFGPVAIVAAITAILAGGGFLSKPVIDFVSGVFEALKETEHKRKLESERTDEGFDLLGRRYEIMSDMAYQLTENLQEEREETRRVTAELKAQNQQQQLEINRLKEAHQREIAELKEQIHLMGVEKSSDKEKIILLESQVQQLQDRVKELEDWGTKLDAENKRLQDENHQLRVGPRRRSTDNLNPANLPQGQDAQ